MQKSLHRFCTGAVMPVKMLSLWMLTLAAGKLQAQSYKSLRDKVYLQFNNSNAQDIVKSLQKQTPYTFVYDPEYLQHCPVAAAKFTGSPLHAVLEYLDYNSPLDIEMTGNSTIALKRGRADRPESRAQGRVTGRVSDSKNEPLPGVTIHASNGMGTVSNVDGTFDLPLEPGKYDITFSFISFDSRKITDVQISPKNATALNVVLYSNSSRLKEVTVTGTYARASAEGLYAIQKNSAGITDGISADQIGRTPDKNLGEVLKRVSGMSTMENKYVVVRGLSERYNQAILNGQIMPSTELNRKNFNYDIIPSALIENVTVIKTLTPDRSAEFGGGLVEVNTLGIPTQSFFNISVGGSYNDKTTGKDFLTLPLEGKEYRGQISDHRKWFGGTNWNSTTELANANATWEKGKPAYANNWILTDLKAPVSPNIQIAGGKIINRHFGFVGAIGYRTTFSTQDVINGRDGFQQQSGTAAKDSMLFHGQRYGFTNNINGLVGVGYRDDKNKITYQGLYLQVLDQQLTVGRGHHDESGPNALAVQDIATQSKILQNQLKGEHALNFGGLKVKWMASYIDLDKIRPDNHFLIADSYEDKSARFNQFNIRAPFATGRDGTLRWWSRAKEKNFNWDLNIAAPFNAGPVANTAKIGYAGWNKDRLFFVSNSSSKGYSGEFYQPLQKFFTDSSVITKLTDGGDDFKANVTLHALYAMLDDKFGKFRLVWGLRAEYYNLNDANAVLQHELKSTNNGNKDLDISAVLNREPNWRFFPSANLTYSLTPKMNLRLAYAESIIRPDIRELSFFREYDYELGGDYVGENLIRSTTIRHYDFRYEWYPAPGDIISASLFMKDLSYPMEIYKQGVNRLFTLQNNKSAQNYGAEIEVRKSFAFTQVPVVKNITVYGNFSYLDAWVKPLTTTIKLDTVIPNKLSVYETTGKLEHRPQAGASNYMMNAGIYYDTKPLSLSLSYNFVGNRMFRPAAFYPQSLMEQPLNALDGQIMVRFLRGKGECKISVANILNAYSIVYENTYNDDPAIQFGKAPSKQQLAYQKEKDLINYRLSPGRTYSATVTYKF